MKDARIIKKYPNRRLYDTTISSYITLDDVKKLVLECIPFQVVDARTGEDLTHSTLLQIITEQEGTDHPIFTTQLLQQIIRFYGHSMQQMMSGFLEQSMALFAEQQATQQARMQQLMDNPSVAWMKNLTEHNLALWKKWQENFYPKDNDKKPE